MRFQFFEHTADVKFAAYGKTMGESFGNVALAFSSIVTRGEKVTLTKKKSIVIRAADAKNMLYHFIEELIYLFEVDRFVVGRAKVEIRGNTLRATLRGDDASAFRNLGSVKAATYAEMKVGRENSVWVAQAVVDV